MNAKRLMQFISIFALLVWGGVFLYFYLVQNPETGKSLIASYVNTNKNFDLWVLIAGMGLIVLGLFNLVTFKQATGTCTHDHAHGDACDHDHHHHDHDHGDEIHDHDHDQTASGLAFSILILIVPVLVAANYSPGKFSNNYSLKQNQIADQLAALEREKRKESIGNNVAEIADEAGVGVPVEEPDGADDAEYVLEFTMEDLEKMVPKNEEGQFLLDVPLIFNTAGDRQLMKVMEGIPVTFDAQVMEENFYNPEGNRIRAFRLMIECCAADARPLSIPVQFEDEIPAYEEMGWYKFTGNLHYAFEQDEHIAVLKVKTMDETAEVIDMIY